MNTYRKNIAFMAICCTCVIIDIVYAAIGAQLGQTGEYVLGAFGAILFTFVGLCMFQYTLFCCLSGEHKRFVINIIVYTAMLAIIVLCVLEYKLNIGLKFWMFENTYNICTIIFVVVCLCIPKYAVDNHFLGKILSNVIPITIGIFLQGIYQDFPFASIGLLVTIFMVDIGGLDVFTDEGYIRKLRHDIITPVSGIKGVVEMSEYYSNNDEKQKELRDKLLDVSDFLLDVANNFGKEDICTKSQNTEYVPDTSIKGVRVLIVEDNELNMEIAKFHLEGAGAIVKNVWNGLEALELFEKSQPIDFDVILMDVTMPVMGGLEATTRIRAMDREDAKNIPIFAMTANVFADDVAQCIKVGMNEYIAKPIQANSIVSLIKQYCNKE